MKKTILSLISTSFIFSLIKWLHHWTSILLTARSNFLTEKILQELSIFNDKSEVIFGPLKGCKFSLYDTKIPHGLSFNAILGSIEYELHDIVEEIIARDYSKIIVIGAAEGYYAVGFALKSSGTHVIAYETVPDYQQMILNNAKLNQVENRIIVNGNFDASIIPELHLNDGGTTCIFCDCEGYEKVIFSKENKIYFQNIDLLIEIHDLVDPEISLQIKSLFVDSHHIEIINSIDDDIRPYDFGNRIPELTKLSYNAKRVALADNRPTQMQWFWMKSKSNA